MQRGNGRPGRFWPSDFWVEIGARGRNRTRTGDALDVVSLLVGLREQKEMEPPAGDAPAGILYKRNPQAAAWRRAKLNFGSLLNASPSKDKATGLQNNDGCDVVFPS